MPSTASPALPHLSETLHALGAGSAEADAAGRLQAKQICLIHDNDWLRLLVPQAIGGRELPLPEMVRLEEAIAQADGSCGWVVTLCAGAAWFTGFLPPELGRQIMATPQVCLAGSGAPTGYAERDGEGWRLNGQWRHASGSQLVTHFTFNAQLREDGQAMLDAQGRARTCAFVVLATQVVVEADSWHSVGLRATTSQAFSVQNLWVPQAQAFVIDANHATATGPLYRFPFEALAFVTLAANLLGMARHFMVLAQPLAVRHLPHLNGPSAELQELWQSCDQSLQSLRSDFYAQLDSVWLATLQGAADAAHNQQLVNTSRALARHARECVDALYPCCGLQAADPRTEINRVWRDLHTASQHAIWLR